MKKTVLVIFFAIIINISFSQQIPNSDFESWENVNNATGWTCYMTINGLNITTATRSSEAFSGQYCAKLQTNTLVTGDVIPGMIQLGQLNMDLLEPEGGIPFTDKPSAIEVKLKYLQQGGDSLVIFCYLSKYNKKSGKSEKIGGMYFTYDKPIDEYTSFVFPIYYVAEGTPDTINIGFFSSNQQPHDGSTLYVDSLVLRYGEVYLPPQADFPINVTDTGFTAKWSGADYTKSYILQVASDENFQNILPDYNDINIGDTTEYYVVVKDTNIKKIYYRVKADYDTIITDYSNVISFAVPYAPKVYTQNITDNSFTAVWQDLESADFYYFDVANNSIFTDIFNNWLSIVVYDTSIVVYDLQPNTTYYYRVAARYEIVGKGRFSDSIEVTTLPEPEKYDLKILTLSNSLAFDTDTTFLNSSLNIYFYTGQVFWTGKLTSTFTEIPIPATDLYIIQIVKPDGEIIRKKMTIVIDE